MIQNPSDLAGLLAFALNREAAGEVLANGVKTTVFMAPPQAVFTVQTAEGKEFLVTVQEQAVRVPPPPAREPKICPRCHGTILPPARIGTPRGTCHCATNLL